MVVRKKKIIIEGQKVEVPVFDTKITPGKEIDTGILDRLAKEEDIEKKLQDIIKQIRIVRVRYKNVVKNINYFYTIGKILQFVDKDDCLKQQRGKIWQRMNLDYAPELFLFDPKKFSDYKKMVKESKRYPEFMYLLAKVPKKFLKEASWDQWREILKFPEIYKKQKLLRQILTECKSGISGPSLRNKIKDLIKK
jgi:hypothetical protein